MEGKHHLLPAEGHQNQMGHQWLPAHPHSPALCSQLFLLTADPVHQGPGPSPYTCRQTRRGPAAHRPPMISSFAKFHFQGQMCLASHMDWIWAPLIVQLRSWTFTAPDPPSSKLALIPIVNPLSGDEQWFCLCA